MKCPDCGSARFVAWLRDKGTTVQCLECGLAWERGLLTKDVDEQDRRRGSDAA